MSCEDYGWADLQKIQMFLGVNLRLVRTTDWLTYGQNLRFLGINLCHVRTTAWLIYSR